MTAVIGLGSDGKPRGVKNTRTFADISKDSSDDVSKTVGMLVPDNLERVVAG